MVCLSVKSAEEVSECERRLQNGHVADDAGAFHLAMAGRVVHDRVVLGAAVVPDRDAVGLPAPAHLVFGDAAPG